MRDLHELDRYRLTDARVIQLYGSIGDGLSGAFTVPSPIDGAALVVVADANPDAGWDHVSVSRQKRTPNWQEMEHIARLFFRPDETWVQYHVPASDHINVHPNCLHWWRCQNQPFPRPPQGFV